MNNVTIDITTVTGGGKTALSHKIGSILRQHGFDVVINDDNGVGQVEQTEQQGFDRMDKAIEGLVNKQTSVRINTHQIRRNYV